MSFIVHVSPHSGIISAIKKNGSQHTTNAPVMIANVLAAFRSRFASSVSLRAFTLFCGFEMPPVGTNFAVVGCFCWCSLILLIWFGGGTGNGCCCINGCCAVASDNFVSIVWWLFVCISGDGGADNWFCTIVAADAGVKRLLLTTPNVVSFSWFSLSPFWCCCCCPEPTTCCETVSIISLDDDVGPCEKLHAQEKTRKKNWRWEMVCASTWKCTRDETQRTTNEAKLLRSRAILFVVCFRQLITHTLFCREIYQR